MLVTGKGGTGKSLVAIRLAAQAAENGENVLLVEASRVAKLFAKLGIPQPPENKPVAIANNLSVVNLSAKKCLEEYVTKYLGLRFVFERIVNQPAIKSLLDNIPGLDDLMILGKLYHEADIVGTYDRIIVDCPASGHFLSLVGTPRGVLNSGVTGPFVGDVRKTATWLASREKCGFVYVTNPDRLVMSETTEFIPIILSKGAVNLSAVVLNRAVPQNWAERESWQAAPDSPTLRYVRDRAIQQVEIQKQTQTVLDESGLDPLFWLPEVGPIDFPMKVSDFSVPKSNLSQMVFHSTSEFTVDF